LATEQHFSFLFSPQRIIFGSTEQAEQVEAALIMFKFYCQFPFQSPPNSLPALCTVFMKPAGLYLAEIHVFSVECTEA